jgi:chaperone modulatory protein CbpM
MADQHIALLLEETRLTLDEFALGCAVSREWIVEHVRAGVLLDDPNSDPGQWAFTGRDLLRARRLHRLERDFDANPELAGLVADMFDELELLRSRLRCAGLSID